MSVRQEEDVVSLRHLDAAFGLSQAEKINGLRAGFYVLVGDNGRGEMTTGRIVPIRYVADTRPVRIKPGCPPVRDAEHRAKHRKRKAARAARKVNR